jgi:hypothetical protein
MLAACPFVTFFTQPIKARPMSRGCSSQLHGLDRRQRRWFTRLALAHHPRIVLIMASKVIPSVERRRNFLHANRSTQTVAQRIAVHGVITAPRAMPKFHSREPHLTKKLDAEPT